MSSVCGVGSSLFAWNSSACSPGGGVGEGGGGILPKSLGGGVPHGSQNPDPISDQNI